MNDHTNNIYGDTSMLTPKELLALTDLEIDHGSDSPEAHAFVQECQARRAQRDAEKRTNGAMPSVQSANGVSHIPETAATEETPSGDDLDTNMVVLTLDRNHGRSEPPPERVIAPIANLDEATIRAQAEACAAILEVELPRLLQVTPRLQLFCQHPQGELYAVSGIFDD